MQPSCEDVAETLPVICELFFLLSFLYAQETSALKAWLWLFPVRLLRLSCLREQKWVCMERAPLLQPRVPGCWCPALARGDCTWGLAEAGIGIKKSAETILTGDTKLRLLPGALVRCVVPLLERLHQRLLPSRALGPRRDSVTSSPRSPLL